LILMDLHMPVLNGYEATKALRNTSQVPIVAMTADAIDGVRELCISIGMNDFISKPFDPEGFIKKVTGYFDNRESQAIERVVDQELGIKLMGGSQKLYDKVKTVFIDENKDTLIRLGEYIEAGSYSEAAELIHKVKSSAGSLGAESVRLHATSLQEALTNKDDETINHIYERFVQLFKKMIEEISTESEPQEEDKS